MHTYMYAQESQSFKAHAHMVLKYIICTRATKAAARQRDRPGYTHVHIKIITYTRTKKASIPTHIHCISS
jgi:hypothetical protein